MKYIALLRGINVGGKNVIRMTDLVRSFEKAGFTGVSTYIQSGNVIFESDITDRVELVSRIEKVLSKDYSYDSRVIVRSFAEMKVIVSRFPKSWTDGSDVRCYIAFIREPKSVSDVIGEVETREGVDEVVAGHNELYLSTQMSGLTKSKFTKLIGKPIYRHLSMRNKNTTEAIVRRMED